MGWIIFGIWMFLGIVINVCMSVEKDLPEESKKCGMHPVTWFFLGVAGLGLLILILYGLGWIWYYFCSGFLVFESHSFFDTVVFGLISLVMFALFCGFVAILFGWDPSRRR